GGPCGPPWASPPHWLLSCPIATALFLTQVNRHAKSRAELRGSISAEAAGRNDGLKFREVEVADRVQRLGGGAVLQVLRQSVQPGAEGEIRGEKDRGALVEPADEVEEKLPAGL